MAFPLQGDYHSTVQQRQRRGAYTLICRRQHAAGAAARGLTPSAEDWEGKDLVGINTRCRRKRDDWELSKPCHRGKVCLPVCSQTLMSCHGAELAKFNTGAWLFLQAL